MSKKLSYFLVNWPTLLIELADNISRSITWFFKSLSKA